VSDSLSMVVCSTWAASHGRRQAGCGEIASSGAFAFAGLHLVEWQLAHQRIGDGYEILYAGNPRDVDYIYDFNHPKTIVSAGERSFRANEVHLTQLGVAATFITIMSAPG